MNFLELQNDLCVLDILLSEKNNAFLNDLLFGVVI